MSHQVEELAAELGLKLRDDIAIGIRLQSAFKRHLSDIEILVDAGLTGARCLELMGSIQTRRGKELTVKYFLTLLERARKSAANGSRALHRPVAAQAPRGSVPAPIRSIPTQQSEPSVTRQSPEVKPTNLLNKAASVKGKNLDEIMSTSKKE